jgi:flagellar P-ring protein precursor FlgI
MNHLKKWIVFCLLVSATCSIAAASNVRLKDIARIANARENALVGYGIVVGLSGSGDSSRNRATLQTLANTLANFGVKISDDDLNARNTAAVMVTGTLPAFAEEGDKLDVQISSLGDARSLAGGTLVLTPLYGPDQKLYALAQGALAVGGFQVESNGNSVQKNYPTAGRIPRGANVETSPQRKDSSEQRTVSIILNEPDYTTAQRVTSAISSALNIRQVKAVHPGKIEVTLPGNGQYMEVVAALENIVVTPDYASRIVVNERNGTIVAGSNVRIGAVSIAQGDLQIVIKTDYEVSQPYFYGRANSEIQTTVVPHTDIDVQEREPGLVQMAEGVTVGELVQSLQRIHVNMRDIITILQSIKSAGALHAELIIQ